jgi:hypothetical protein
MLLEHDCAFHGVLHIGSFQSQHIRVSLAVCLLRENPDGIPRCIAQ